MGCEQTEFRLLLHAHDELGVWERWSVNWHLHRCPCCRELRDRFERERWALAGCLSSPLMHEPARRLAPHLNQVRPTPASARAAVRRSPALVLALLVLLMAGAALACVELQNLPGGFWGAGGGCAPAPGVGTSAPAAL